MSAVQGLLDGLHKFGMSASWINTGGGCMAVQVEFSYQFPLGHREYEILITDREDIFSRSDEFSDDDVSGFYACLRMFGADGDEIYGDRDAVIVYHTSADAGLCRSSALAGEPVVNLQAEVAACVDAVTRVAFLVHNAPVVGDEGF